MKKSSVLFQFSCAFAIFLAYALPVQAFDASLMTTVTQAIEDGALRSETIEAARNDAKMFIQTGQMTQKLKLAIEEVRKTKTNSSDEEIAATIARGKFKLQDKEISSGAPAAAPANLGH